MPGGKCYIVECGSSRRTKSLGILKLPAESVNPEWRKKWLNEIKKTREMGTNFKTQLKRDSIYTSHVKDILYRNVLTYKCIKRKRKSYYIQI